MSGIIRYGFINTKIRGFKREYMKMEDYNKLLDVEYRDVVKVLMETSYRDYLKGLKETPSPAEMEKMLIQSLTKSYLNVLKWLPEQAMKVIALHMMKYEAENIKAALRLKTLNSQIDRLKQHLIPIPLGLKIEEYIKAYEEAKTPVDLIEKLFEMGIPLPIHKIVKEGSIDDVKVIEARIDKTIFEAILSEARKLDRKSSRSIREMLGVEIDLTNIKNTLRAKKLKMDWKEFEENIITPTYKVSVKKIKTAFEKEDQKEILKELMEKDYKTLLTKSIEALTGGGIEELEKLFNREIYRNYQKVWKKGFQYDISPVLAYLTKKWTEIRNLKIIIYGKSLEIPKKKIMEEIII